MSLLSELETGTYIADSELADASSRAGMRARKIPGRALYISPIDMRQSNGMSQLQKQLLGMLGSMYESVDILSLGASPAGARRWLFDEDLTATVIEGIFAQLAWLNCMAWYGGGVILCNRLRWIDRFSFPLKTPLPISWFDRYAVIVCFYPWAHRLLKLERAGRKVIVCTGDVMADRHERIGTRRWITLTGRDERATLESESRSLAVSEDDAAEFKRLYGVQMPALRFLPPACSELVCLATGRRSARVGFLGAPSFVNEEILELLSQPGFLGCLAKEGIELVVAGGICNTVQPEVLHALERGGARVLGPIASAVDFYAQVGAVLNPVGPSTGVKIKSVEALMAGRGLITTRWGAEESLRAAFPGQVTYIEWPIDASILAELTVKVVRDAKPADPAAAEKYATQSNEILRSLLLP